MTQNGVPRVPVVLNADGDASNFAVQALSRFIVSHSLVKAGALAPGCVVLAVANPGQDLAGLSVDDLSLQHMACRTTLGAWLAQSARDSCVLDAFITEQIDKFPQYKWFHVWPGLVASEYYPFEAFPFPVNLVLRVAVRTPIAKSTQALADLIAYVSAGTSWVDARLC
jgi:hypothetical protein